MKILKIKIVFWDLNLKKSHPKQENEYLQLILQVLVELNAFTPETQGFGEK